VTQSGKGAGGGWACTGHGHAARAAVWVGLSLREVGRIEKYAVFFFEAFVFFISVPPNGVAGRPLYLVEVYLVTALVPSDTACLASSPGRIRRTEVWISRDEIVERLL
jgi:hypothetical protein